MSRLDWGIGNQYIESIKFTMSNGDVSPKYGVKIITDFCLFESPINKILMYVADRRLVGLTFYTEHDGEFLVITAPKLSVGTTMHELVYSETLLGFNMRVADKSLQGMSINIASSNEIIQ